MRFFSVGILILSFSAQIAAQKTEFNIISNIKEYKIQVQDDSLHQMVELKTVMPGIVYDLRYATENNFMQRKLYTTDDITLLRKKAAIELSNVQASLKPLGFGIKIFDAYRPYSITEKMWELIKDDRYVANPKNGSNHNRGTAVDLTLINLQTGEELNMGTGFDHFSDTAHHSFQNLPDDVLANRKLLRTTMEQFGFKAMETEWWHYSLPDSKNYDVLDISLKKWKRNL